MSREAKQDLNVRADRCERKSTVAQRRAGIECRCYIRMWRILRTKGNLVVTVSVLGSVDLVTDERSAADHLADSENTVSLDSVDADMLPVALGKELSPVSLIGGFGPDLTVCREDCVE